MFGDMGNKIKATLIMHKFYFSFFDEKQILCKFLIVIPLGDS